MIYKEIRVLAQETAGRRTTHVLLNILSGVLWKCEPSLLVLQLERGIFAGEMVLDLQTGGHSCHRTVSRMRQDIGERF